MKKILNNLLYIGLFSLAIIFSTSCGDKEKDGISKADVVGNWTFNSTSTEITINNMSLVDFFLATIDSITQAEAEFYAAGYTPDLIGYMNFKSDDSYVMDLGLGQGEFRGRWSLGPDGKQILLDENTSYELIIDLLSVCSNSMLVSYSFSYTINADGDDQPDTEVDKYNIALIK